MNGDLTRDTFDPLAGYTAVRAQQGRVMLDADHNEQADIQLFDRRQGRRDLVGESGAPADEPGFGLTLAGGQPALTAGRYLVNGIRVRNASQVPLASGQPFLAGNTLPVTQGAWLAYLELWERPLTAVEEPSIREVALGGPDTTLRDRLVWQVRWLRLGNADQTFTCADADTALHDLARLYDGTLEPRLETSGASGPCIVSEAAQFRGLENQLYRVEIHRGSIDANGGAIGGTPTFKWSRDNGAVVAGYVALISASPIRMEVERLGPGGAAGFERGVTIEVRNEGAVLAGTPGILARVDDVEGDALRLSLLDGATVAALQLVLGNPPVVIRRWDSAGAPPITTGATWSNLEDGIQVRFSGGRYRTGDFWLLPARTASLPGTTSQLDWPLAGAAFEALESRGPVRHRAALAILDRSGAGAWTFRRDCRRLFPPLTSVLTLADAGGDGQHGPSGEWLPAPLAVVVSRGRIPAPGVTVRFSVSGSAGGGLSTALPSAGPTPANQIDVTTDGTGRAQVFWRLGAGPARRQAAATWEPATAQRVDVVCLGPAGTPDGPTLAFVAQTLDRLNLHMAGGNGQYGRPGERLEVALRARVDDGQRPVENAVVEFSVLNRMFEGAPLNQHSGGSVLASARFVSGDAWPGGTLHHTVRTTTDADGVAQVQWTLGTQLELSTQRVEARLLDRDAQRTPQTALYIAQLAIAQEVVWLPRVPWLAAVLTSANRHVQAAIDAIAERLDQVALSTTAFDPFQGAQWRATDNVMFGLDATSTISLTRFAAVSFRSDLVPAGRDTSALTHHAGVRVYAELLDASGGLSPVMRLTGNFRRAGTRWEWTLSSEARGALTRLVTPSNPTVVVPVRITVVPRWLPGGLPGDSSVSHEMVFLLVVGAMPYGPYGLRIAIGGGLL